MGIMSFQGNRPTIKKNFEATIKVSDHMCSTLITFSPEQSLIEVMELLVKHKITGGPVVDENDVLLGIISDSDCMKKISENRYFNIPMGGTNKVKEYMSSTVETIDAEESIFDAAIKFSKSPYRRFPVISEGHLVGQISQGDVLHAALELHAEHWRDNSKMKSMAY